MNLDETFQAQAATRPHAVAIHDTWRGRSRATTFANFEAAAGQAAALLWQARLRPGDPVLVFAPMSLELYVALRAILRLGLIAIFIDPSAGREHIEQCCDIYPPKALIATSKAHLLRLVSPALRRIPLRFAIGHRVPGAFAWDRARALAPRTESYVHRRDTPVLVTFTSGSTGEPKAAVRTHGFLQEQIHALEAFLAPIPGEVDLATMPMFLFLNLATGVTSLIPDADLRRPGHIHAVRLIRQIQHHRVATTVASPALLERLARFCGEEGLTLPHLRQVATGGAPVFPPLLDRLREIAPNASIRAVYGSTEAEPIAGFDHLELCEADRTAMRSGRGLLAGRPVPEIGLRIMRDQWGRPVGSYTVEEFAAQCLPPGESGEIVVSGDHVLQSYLHGRGDEETKFRVDGTVWHRTGDSGYLDPEGRLWLLGRCAARIEDEHGILHPFSVECALSFLPEVRRAAVVAHRGRRILALELHDAADHDTGPFRQAVAWAQVDDIRLYRRIPVDRRHNAKIDYPALHRLLERG